MCGVTWYSMVWGGACIWCGYGMVPRSPAVAVAIAVALTVAVAVAVAMPYCYPVPRCCRAVYCCLFDAVSCFPPHKGGSAPRSPAAAQRRGREGCRCGEYYFRPCRIVILVMFTASVV